MTYATFNYLHNDFVSFVINGHSGYQHKGLDIVCSAITTATYSTINLIDKFYGLDKFVLVEKADEGYIELTIKQIINQDNLRTIIESFIEILDNIQKQYPENLKINIAKK